MIELFDGVGVLYEDGEDKAFKGYGAEECESEEDGEGDSEEYWDGADAECAQPSGGAGEGSGSKDGEG